ncbi:hypothetical protein [Phaeovulum sp. W22_SRMD_FR3]|uniref:hypothetical protein n=1 Tax=Phaeovulum sp. W22_SRMD_FR3 TaxID=3240274 RepID=UPI003F97E917
MRGVIVWSDAEKASAVIWCEDQGQLAYARGRDNLMGGEIWPSLGDLVEFTVGAIRGIRRAREMRVIAEEWHPSLAIELHAAARGLTPLDEATAVYPMKRNAAVWR